jgi:outer membrane protein
LPIFDNFGTNAQIQSAKYQQTQKEFELLQLEQSIRKSVQTAYLTLEAAEKQIDITQRTLKFSEQNFESNKERYSVGAAQITEYQIAANQLLSAQINRVTAVYNYIQAQKSLLYAMGRL